MITAQQLDELERLGKAATGGPWTFRKQWNEGECPTLTYGARDEYGDYAVMQDGDYEFAAIARNTFQSLIDTVRELQSQQRLIFDAGFKTCRHFGDNHHHYAGEQADKVFERAMKLLLTKPENKSCPSTNE